MLKLFEDGITPVSVKAHESVAKHYGLASVNVGAALAAGAQDWKTYGGTHPKKEGYPSTRRERSVMPKQILSHIESILSPAHPGQPGSKGS